MATNKRFMPVPPTAVWDSLADVGGFGPIKVSDHTEALESEARNAESLARLEELAIRRAR